MMQDSQARNILGRHPEKGDVYYLARTYSPTEWVNAMLSGSNKISIPFVDKTEAGAYRNLLDQQYPINLD